LRIVDLRYNGGAHIVRGNHPRLEGIWPQYSGLNTGLGKNVVITDVLSPDTPIENWQGHRVPPATTEFQDESEYPHHHNHYQNLLSELWNFTPNINGVAVWGDSGAFVPDAKSWGGFFSARSWPVHWKEYVPEGSPAFKDEEFDAQLVGLEIDVLNGGLPYPERLPGWKRPLGKTGLQIVGFGKRNNAAIEIRSEDSDANIPHHKRKGMWNYGVIAYNALDRNSTFLYAAYPEGRRGLDLGHTSYREGAVRIKSTKAGTGIVFNEGRGGEIYVDSSADDALVIRAGLGGIRFVGANGSDCGFLVTRRELFVVGGIPTVICLALAVSCIRLNQRLRRLGADVRRS